MDDHILVRVCDVGTDIGCRSADQDVFLKETRRIEIKHLTRVGLQGIFPGRQRIRQTKVVGESDGIAFYFFG